MIRKTMCRDTEALRLMELAQARALEELEHAQRGLNVHCDTKAVRGVVDQAERVWEFDQIVAVWEPVVNHFTDQEPEFFQGDVNAYAKKLREKASDALTTISFERLTRWNFYEQKARLTVASRLQEIYKEVYYKNKNAA